MYLLHNPHHLLPTERLRLIQLRHHQPDRFQVFPRLISLLGPFLVPLGGLDYYTSLAPDLLRVREFLLFLSFRHNNLYSK